MSIVLNKVLLNLSVILVLTLFIGIRAMDVAHADQLVQSNQDQNAPNAIHNMAKRRFLPTRRELYQYINGEISDDDDEEEEDKSHLNTKRYFLKSKRYFLNSKRDNERREEE